MAMKVLITGIAGAVGYYLAQYIILNHPGVQIFGTCRTADTGPMGKWVLFHPVHFLTWDLSKSPLPHGLLSLIGISEGSLTTP